MVNIAFNYSNKPLPAATRWFPWGENLMIVILTPETSSDALRETFAVSFSVLLQK